MQTVLGLSITATSGAWVLLDGQSPDAATLDDDAFDVRPDDGAGHPSLHVAAVRGAQAIAATSGHKVGAIHVTWTENVEADATALLGSLADLGFDNVHAVPLSEAAQGWGIDIGRENEHAKIGLCILEPDTATLMIVATPAGSVRTAIIDTRETPEDLIEWLKTVFDKDGWSPEALYLLGALADLDEVLEPIAGAVPVPVADSADTQLALARGAALATATQFDAGAARPAERPWRMSLPKKVITAETETVAMATAEPVDPDSAPAAEALRNDEPRRDRPWLVSHAKKVTLSAAAVAVFGVALSLTAGSALNIEDTSTQAAEPAAESAPLTSAAPRPVPAPTSAAPAPQARPLAARPPAPPTPPQTFAPPADSGTVADEPVTVPHHTAFGSPPAAVPAAVPDVPLPGSPRGVPPGPEFVEPLGPPPGPPPAAPLDVPAAPPPLAPLALPPGPAPAVPLVVPAAPEPLAPLGPAPGPQPLGPPPGPQPADPLALPAASAPAAIAAPSPPPAAPLAVPPAHVAVPQAPVAAPPADVAPPAGAADSAPPPDPIQAVLGPLVAPLP